MTPEQIRDEIARQLGIPLVEMTSRRRQFSKARAFAILMCRRLTDCTIPRIGMAFGDRDQHSTALAAGKAVLMLEDHPELAEYARQFVAAYQGRRPIDDARELAFAAAMQGKTYATVPYAGPQPQTHMGI